MSDATPTADTAVNAVPGPVTAQQETFSLDYVQGLRSEAAKYRTEKNEAVERAKAEVIKDYEAQLSDKESAFNQIQTDLSERSLELLKLKAIVSEGIATSDILDVLALVQGTDEATVSESVKRVKSLMGKAPERDRPTDPSQGTGNNEPLPLNGDPLLKKIMEIVGS